MDKIYIGADYYPEAWEEDRIDFDIEKMKECGFNVVRIGEFAWQKDEPEEGKFDFSWLHRVVDKMGEAGIRVIMGTPTAAPPHWLYKKYPDMAVLSDQGIRKAHGGRRHCCSSHSDFIKHSMIIVEKLAQEFGSDKNVIGWQIDNEIYPNDPGCCCMYCREAFHRRLREKYGSVEEINRAWNLNIFSQNYESIDDIPIPINGWHNPQIKLEWALSQAQNHIEFVHMQAGILKKYTSAPIGTDTMPRNAMDYRKLNDKLNVAQFNHYNVPGNITVAAMWMDYMKHFSKIPFWNTETQPCWNGSTAPGMPLLPEGFIYMNTWLPFILGGNVNLYWLWRTHWAGQELMHGAVIDTCGRYTIANEDIRRAVSDLRKAERVLCQTTPMYDTALVFTSLNFNIQKSQTINNSIKDVEGNCHDFYKAMLKIGIHTDVIDLGEKLDQYKLIISPLAFTLDEYNFRDRITKWVQNGGVWVVGPLTDIRSENGTKYKTSPYGFLEELTGIQLAYTLPDDEGLLTCMNDEGQIVKCGRSYEIFEQGDFKSLITVENGYSSLAGKACVAEVSAGKGKIIWLGTFPEEKELRRILERAANHACICRGNITEGMMLTKREGNGLKAVIASATDGKECEYHFEGKMKDMLTGIEYQSGIVLKPYEVAVLEEIV